MTRLVQIALARPYTFIVLAILILIIGPLVALRTPTDIFPNIGIPVIGVAFQFTGLSPEQMEDRILAPFERSTPATINNVEHSESTSLLGIGIIKIFLREGADIRMANAQVTAVAQTILKQMPAGITPPLIINYDASTVPVIQVAATSDTLTEQQLFDSAQSVMRPLLGTVQGAAIPYSFGGKVRQIQINLDPVALQAKHLSAADVETAITNQNQIIPAGQVKIGTLQYNVDLNDAARAVGDFDDLPIKTLNGATVFVHDVAHVSDSAPPQQNIVHVDGRRAVLMTILKTGSASTLSVIGGVKDALPNILTLLPRSFHTITLNDQSLFVTAAVTGVMRESAIAAALTCLMILLFLGTWRSALIIAVSIPLSILASIIGLSADGDTLNIMTLGGLALAVGILVDDATVTIENINRHLEEGKDIKAAILDGAAQIATPVFVSTLCICIVFLPMLSLGGVAGYLFVPLARAVIFAMIASYILSFTLIPTMAMYLLKQDDKSGVSSNRIVAALGQLQRRFEHQFEAFRAGYQRLLQNAMNHRRGFALTFISLSLVSLTLVPFLGENFFPEVDAGQILIHVRPRVGTRIETASALFGDIETRIRKIIPGDEVNSIADNIGLPISPLNIIYSTSGGIGYSDGDIYVSLNPGHHATANYVGQLRAALPSLFPSTTFSFLPADIVSQILNFGSPAPIDVQITGPNTQANIAYADDLLRGMKNIRGVADARIQQSLSQPDLHVDVDRARAAQFGLTESNVTSAVADSLAGTAQTAQTYWLDPANSVTYPVSVQTPEYRVDSLSDLENIPVTGSPAGTQILGGLASISRERTPAVVSHYNVLPAVDIYASTENRDLGGAARDVSALIKSASSHAPRGLTVTLRGQVLTMNRAFSGLVVGLIGAIVLVYLLIVVNFQSWLDPFVIITALPAALAGIVWILFATETTLSVPALTGAIMCMGVATANSILVVSFARERLDATGDATQAALEAGVTRFRPVLMTALAMVVGMLPMALGLGEGGEQNAPLGRAVIGGLGVATIATLMFVPVVFSIVHGRQAKRDRVPTSGAIGGSHV